MAEAKGRKRKVRWVVGSQAGTTVAVAPPATRRQGRKGVSPPKAHRRVPRRR